MKDEYQSLTVWQKSMSLAKGVYEVTSLLPKEEKYGLSDQIRRAAVSVPSNIAEGSRRGSKKEFAQFLKIAHGSLAETETQLILISEIYPNIKVSNLLSISNEVGRMIYALIMKLEKITS